ncbi:MAG: M28 family peptidase [Vicinamibacterales bacterium]
MLGSEYFAQHPICAPKDSIVADLTLDMPFLFHPLLDIVPYGAQHSTLAGPVGQAAKRLGLAIGEDPIPEQVLFIRSDHFSFVRQGVPSLFIKSGFQTGDPARDGAAINAAYRRDVPQAQRRHVAAVRLRGRRRARAHELPTGWLVACGDGAPRLESGGTSSGGT